jgi:hypothetical protein
MLGDKFTDKQKKDFINRNKDKKGWLASRDIRSGNMSSLDTRELAKLVCKDFKVAFDNQLPFQDERYKICFELDLKDRMIEELDRFDDLVLIDIATMVMSSRFSLSNEMTLSELLHWNALKGDWIEVYKAFCRYQNGQKIQDFKYFHPFPPIPDTNETQYRSDEKEHVVIKINKFIKLYKALKIGWKEIQENYVGDTYNTLFIKIIAEYYTRSFNSRTNPPKQQSNQITHSRKTVVLAKFPEVMKKHLERLSNDGNSDHSCREFYRMTLEEYNREPHGLGLEKAFAVLKKIVRKDTQVMQSFIDFYAALTIVGKFSKKSFDDFLLCDGIENFLQNYDLTSKDMLDRVLDRIKTALRASSDPRVRAAVSEWVKAESKHLDFDVKISRRNEQNPKKRY